MVLARWAMNFARACSTHAQQTQSNYGALQSVLLAENLNGAVDLR
jgi:hypothetical protein